MSDFFHALAAVAVMALITLATRALPFWVWRDGRQVPKTILYLGRVLPGAVMGLLIIYGLKQVRPLVFPHGLPELIGIGVVAALHLWKRNNLLSILGGTAVYMLLVQTIFKAAA